STDSGSDDSAPLDATAVPAVAPLGAVAPEEDPAAGHDFAPVDVLQPEDSSSADSLAWSDDIPDFAPAADNDDLAFMDEGSDNFAAPPGRLSTIPEESPSDLAGSSPLAEAATPSVTDSLPAPPAARAASEDFPASPESSAFDLDSDLELADSLEPESARIERSRPDRGERPGPVTEGAGPRRADAPAASGQRRLGTWAGSVPLTAAALAEQLPQVAQEVAEHRSRLQASANALGVAHIKIHNNFSKLWSPEQTEQSRRDGLAELSGVFLSGSALQDVVGPVDRSADTLAMRFSELLALGPLARTPGLTSVLQELSAHSSLLQVEIQILLKDFTGVHQNAINRLTGLNLVPDERRQWAQVPSRAAVVQDWVAKVLATQAETDRAITLAITDGEPFHAELGVLLALNLGQLTQAQLAVAQVVELLGGPVEYQRHAYTRPFSQLNNFTRSHYHVFGSRVRLLQSALSGQFNILQQFITPQGSQTSTQSLAGSSRMPTWLRQSVPGSTPAPAAAASPGTDGSLAGPAATATHASATSAAVTPMTSASPGVTPSTSSSAGARATPAQTTTGAPAPNAPGAGPLAGRDSPVEEVAMDDSPSISFLR
ncbi:MAG: hypothetical protein ACRC0L_08550, partial [Angustibacter sp.]